MHWTVIEVRDANGRLAKMHDRAVGQVDRDLLVIDPQTALGEMSLNREILKLCTIGRLRNNALAKASQGLALRIVLRRDADPQEHRAPGGLADCRRMAAPVLEVAALAGARIEQRPQPV